MVAQLYVRQICLYLLVYVNDIVSIAINQEAILVNKLLKNYDKHLKPTVLAHTTMQVYITFGLNQIQSLSEVGGTMTSSGFLVTSWKDELISWDPNEYNDTYRIVIPGDQIWLPEINVYNSVVGGNDFALDSKFRVSISYDGWVTWIPPMLWQTSCDMDMTYFPFDKQTCSVTIINWNYRIDLLNFVAGGAGVFLKSYQNSTEWNLESTNVTTSTENWKEFILPTISASFTVSRVSSFYVATIMFPCILLVIVSVLVFLLPPESGEKMALGITVLLSFTIVLVMVADVTPRSQNLPIFMWFVVISMFISGISVICTVIVMNINHHNNNKGVPQWARKMFLQNVASCLCMKHEYFLSDPQQILIQVAKGDNNNIQLKTEQKPNSEIAELRELLERRAEEKEKLERNEEEWQFLAIVIDRMLFCIFSGLVFIFLIAVFSQLLIMPRPEGK